MAARTVPISGSVLAWAREESGLSRSELAEKAKLDEDLIEVWETDEADPSKGQFNALLRVLKRPSALFFLAEPPSNEGMPVALRSAPGLDARTLGPDEARQIRWARRLQDVTSWVEQDQEGKPADVGQVPIETSPESAGLSQRELSGISAAEQLGWSSPSEAFRAWRNYLESQGVLVLQLTMGKGGIRGFSVWDTYAPMVAVNTAYHPTARIFTLFHEYGHLLTRTDAACQSFVRPESSSRGIERWCERFAAAFLLPAEGLTTIAQKYGVTPVAPTDDPDTARLIGNRFSVSTRAAALRLQELGLGADGLYGAVAAQLAGRDWNDSSGGGGGGQPATEKRLGQLGLRIPTRLLAASERGRITTRDLADYLNLNTGQLDDLKGLLIESR